MTKFIKYFVTGGIAAAFDFGLLYILVNIVGWPWYVANTISFTAATLVNYVISIKHVFTSGVRFRKRDEIALTFFVSAIGLLINQSILFLLIHGGVGLWIAKVAGTAIVLGWNYTARHRFVFREPRPEPADDVPPG